MTLVNHGFNGSLDEASFAQMMGIEGAEGVDGSAAWAVTQGAGRQVSVAASSGWAAAAGVSSKDDTGAITASLSTPAAGQWYLITRRIDWSAHTTSVVAIAHTTTSTTIPTVAPTTYPTYNRTPGTLYDQPLAWAWVRNTDTTMALFDLRKLPLATRMLTLETPTVEPADLDALVALSATDGTFKTVQEGGARFERIGGIWVQITAAQFATTGARDTAYAKASGAFLVATGISRALTERFERRYVGTTWVPNAALVDLTPTGVASAGAVTVDGAGLLSVTGLTTGATLRVNVDKATAALCKRVHFIVDCEAQTAAATMSYTAQLANGSTILNAASSYIIKGATADAAVAFYGPAATTSWSAVAARLRSGMRYIFKNLAVTKETTADVIGSVHDASIVNLVDLHATFANTAQTDCDGMQLTFTVSAGNVTATVRVIGEM